MSHKFSPPLLWAQALSKHTLCQVLHLAYSSSSENSPRGSRALSSCPLSRLGPEQRGRLSTGSEPVPLGLTGNSAA